MNDRLFRSDNRLYFSSSFSVSHAYFVKHIVSAVLLKIMNTIRTELFTSVSPTAFLFKRKLQHILTRLT